VRSGRRRKHHAQAGKARKPIRNKIRSARREPTMRALANAQVGSVFANHIQSLTDRKRSKPTREAQSTLSPSRLSVSRSLVRRGNAMKCRRARRTDEATQSRETAYGVSRIRAALQGSKDNSRNGSDSAEAIQWKRFRLRLKGEEGVAGPNARLCGCCGAAREVRRVTVAMAGHSS